MNGVEIGPPLTTLFDAHEIYSFEFLEPRSNTSLGAAQIIGQFPLTRKAFIQFASVFEQHGIDQLGADRDFFAFENEIGHTGPTALRGDVRPFEAQVPVFEGRSVAQALHTKRVNEVLPHPSVFMIGMSTANHQ